MASFLPDENDCGFLWFFRGRAPGEELLRPRGRFLCERVVAKDEVGKTEESTDCGGDPPSGPLQVWLRPCWSGLLLLQLVIIGHSE